MNLVRGAGLWKSLLGPSLLTVVQLKKVQQESSCIGTDGKIILKEYDLPGSNPAETNK